MVADTSLSALSSVENSTTKAAYLLDEYKEHFHSQVQTLVEHVNNLDQQLLHDDSGEAATDLSVTGSMLLEKCASRCRSTLHTLSVEHRELHAPVSKIGKEIDKTFTSDYTGLARHSQNYDKSCRPAVNQLLVQRLVADGRFDVADCLQRESSASTKNAHRRQFTQIAGIRDAIETHNLMTAIAWCDEHADQLNAISSELPRLLHQQQFIQLVMGDRKAQLRAITYAREHLSSYGAQHPQDVGRLMCLLLKPSSTHDSRLARDHDEAMQDGAWRELGAIFHRSACQVLGLPTSDPLTTVLSAGVVALPQLLKLRDIMKTKQEMQRVQQMWALHSDEMPFEIANGQGNPYHSVFACPILRQQTTESNPPMRLSCGHCISRDALAKLQHTSRLKCPYCPRESLAADAIQLHF